jgi:tetratricopeptide (TPR) repeat protein
MAPHFAPGSAWSKAQESDSVRAAGADFARASWKAVAEEQHRRARASKSPEDWRAALKLYDTVLSTWPDDRDAAVLELQAGEAAAQLGDYPEALRRYSAAARSDRDSLAARALWQRVAVTDAWYQASRATGAGGRAPLGRDSLGKAVISTADELLERFPDQPGAADLMWRQGNLSFAHGWYGRAARDLGRMAERYPNDPRAPRAAILEADAHFRRGAFETAGAAYERALEVARRARVDSLQRRAAQAIPVAYYRLAESDAADASRSERTAKRFEKVAARWPEYEHAHLAQYRAGLAYLEAGSPRDAVSAMETLIERFPKSEYVRDAHIQIAKTWEATGDEERSAAAYERFTARFPKDSSTADAWLKAADLYAKAGREDKAEALRLDYLRRHPADFEAAMEILEPLARRDLAGATPELPISRLMAAPRKKPGTPVRPSHLFEYLQLAAKHPDLASKGLLAQVRFLEGEEAYGVYAAVPLRQPLAQSIAAKQKKLDTAIARYRLSVELGVPEWKHASTFRIGQALVAFGEALDRSERPADLQDDALRAYDDVVAGHAQGFYDRGEAVWSDLLRQQSPDAPGDEWITRAQQSLWRRLGGRFYFRPEVEFPLGEGPSDSDRHGKSRPPGRDRREKAHPDSTGSTSLPGVSSSSDLAQRKDSQ